MYRTISSSLGITIVLCVAGAIGIYLVELGQKGEYFKREETGRNVVRPMEQQKSGQAASSARKNSQTKKTNAEEENQDAIVRVSFPQEGEAVGGAIYVTGIAKGSWYFEGEFPVLLMDKQGVVLEQGAAIAQAEWMKEGDVPFQARLDYRPGSKQEATLVLKKSNPSDRPENDGSYQIPVVLEPGMTSTLLYFSSRYHDREISICDKVYPVARPVQESMALAHLTLEKLLKGPEKSEEMLGYSSAIPLNVKIQQFEMVGGKARVDFSREFLQIEVDGPCPRRLIQTQVKETLQQFGDIKEVEITVDGQPIDPLSH